MNKITQLLDSISEVDYRATPYCVPFIPYEKLVEALRCAVEALGSIKDHYAGSESWQYNCPNEALQRIEKILTNKEKEK